MQLMAINYDRNVATNEKHKIWCGDRCPFLYCRLFARVLISSYFFSLYKQRIFSSVVFFIISVDRSLVQKLKSFRMAALFSLNSTANFHRYSKSATHKHTHTQRTQSSHFHFYTFCMRNNYSSTSLFLVAVVGWSVFCFVFLSLSLLAVQFRL